MILTSLRKLGDRLRSPELRPYVIASLIVILILGFFWMRSCNDTPPPTTYDLKGTQEAVREIETSATDRMEDRNRSVDARRDAVDARLNPPKKKNVTAQELEEKLK